MIWGARVEKHRPNLVTGRPRNLSGTWPRVPRDGAFLGSGGDEEFACERERAQLLGLGDEGGDAYDSAVADAVVLEGDARRLQGCTNTHVCKRERERGREEEGEGEGEGQRKRESAREREREREKEIE
eukprot:6111035-Pleurochrysis_carterae.AAC.4